MAAIVYREESELNMGKTNKIFAYLTGATLSTATGIAGAEPVMAEMVPEPTFDTTSGIGDVDADEAESRFSARDASGSVAPDGVADDVLNQQRIAVVNVMVQGFQSLDHLARARLVAEWTLSDSVVRRRTMAQVLSHNFECLGAEGAAAFLTTDPEPVVRREMVDTVMARMSENPKYYRSLLQRLAADSNRKTRKAARHALQELREA